MDSRSDRGAGDSTFLVHDGGARGRPASIPPETVTDYIHAVIEADRTFYTIHVVERMQKQGGSPAAENWRAEKKTLPLPAQFLAEASDLSSKTGTTAQRRTLSWMTSWAVW